MEQRRHQTGEAVNDSYWINRNNELREVIFRKSDKTIIIEMFHDNKGHLGIEKIYNAISEIYHIFKFHYLCCDCIFQWSQSWEYFLIRVVFNDVLFQTITLCQYCVVIILYVPNLFIGQCFGIFSIRMVSIRYALGVMNDIGITKCMFLGEN